MQEYFRATLRAWIFSFNFSLNEFPPGGYSLIYKLYRYVPPQRVGLLRGFGLKTGIHFAHFGLNRVWFLRELRDCMNVFIVSISNE